MLWAGVVTAGGETLTASATEHPDLFRALRGGGGNFGAVTRLRCKLYPVAQVYAGMSWHPADRAAAAGPLRAGRLRRGQPGRRRPPLPPMAVRDHLDLFETVPDSALDAMVEAAADPESPLAFAELRHWGGAMARPSPDAGPVGHPDLPFSVAAMAPYDRGHQPERVDAAMDRLVARLRPGASGGSFLNFLSDPARTETAYTAGTTVGWPA